MSKIIELPLDPTDPEPIEYPVGDYIYSVIMFGLAVYFEHIQAMLNDMGGSITFMEGDGDNPFMNEDFLLGEDENE